MQQPADDYTVDLCLARQAREVVPASLGCDLFLEGGAWRNLRNPVQDLDAAGCAAPLPAALMVVVFVELLNNLNTACVPNFKGCDWQTTDQVEIERFLRDPLNGKPFCNRMCTASCKVLSQLWTAEVLSEVSAENASGCNAPAVLCSWDAFIPGKAPNVPHSMAPLNMLPQFWMCDCVRADPRL